MLFPALHGQRVALVFTERLKVLQKLLEGRHRDQVVVLALQPRYLVQLLEDLAPLRQVDQAQCANRVGVAITDKRQAGEVQA